MAVEERSSKDAPPALAAVFDALAKNLYESRGICALLAGASAVLQEVFDDDGKDVASALSLICDAADWLEGLAEGLDHAQLSLAPYGRSARL